MIFSCVWRFVCLVLFTISLLSPVQTIAHKKYTNIAKNVLYENRRRAFVSIGVFIAQILLQMAFSLRLKQFTWKCYNSACATIKSTATHNRTLNVSLENKSPWLKSCLAFKCDVCTLLRFCFCFCFCFSFSVAWELFLPECVLAHHMCVYHMQTITCTQLWQLEANNFIEKSFLLSWYIAESIYALRSYSSLWIMTWHSSTNRLLSVLCFSLLSERQLFYRYSFWLSPINTFIPRAHNKFELLSNRRKHHTHKKKLFSMSQFNWNTHNKGFAMPWPTVQLLTHLFIYIWRICFAIESSNVRNQFWWLRGSIFWNIKFTLKINIWR